MRLKYNELKEEPEKKSTPRQFAEILFTKTLCLAAF